MGDNRATGGGAGNSGRQEPKLFHDERGAPIKFRIHHGIPHHALEYLIDTIERNGGEVLAKIPQKGYFLLDPSDPGVFENYRHLEKDGRHIVAYTFVRACVARNQIISDEEMKLVKKMIFVRQSGEEQDVPLKVFFDRSIREGQKRNLEKQVTLHGGIVVESEEVARVIIADGQHPARNKLEKKYDKTDRHVEDADWVTNCVRRKRCEHTQPILKKMPGRPPGLRRTDFTAEDIEHLAEYIAKRTTDNKQGGLTGNLLYKELCGNTDEWPWAERHPWQSWRECYRKRVDLFEPKIARARKRYPVEGTKGVFQYSRNVNNGVHHEVLQDDDSSNDEGAAAAPAPTPVRAGAKRTRRDVGDEEDDDDAPGPLNRRRRNGPSSDNNEPGPTAVQGANNGVRSDPPNFLEISDEDDEPGPTAVQGASTTRAVGNDDHRIIFEAARQEIRRVQAGKGKGPADPPTGRFATPQPVRAPSEIEETIPDSMTPRAASVVNQPRERERVVPRQQLRGLSGALETGRGSVAPRATPVVRQPHARASSPDFGAGANEFAAEMGVGPSQGTTVVPTQRTPARKRRETAPVASSPIEQSPLRRVLQPRGSVPAAVPDFLPDDFDHGIQMQDDGGMGMQDDGGMGMQDDDGIGMQYDQGADDYNDNDTRLSPDDARTERNLSFAAAQTQASALSQEEEISDTQALENDQQRLIAQHAPRLHYQSQRLPTTAPTTRVPESNERDNRPMPMTRLPYRTELPQHRSPGRIPHVDLARAAMTPRRRLQKDVDYGTSREIEAELLGGLDDDDESD